MNRIAHKSDFLIRFAFSDADRLPVSMKGVDFEAWFMTRPGATVFMAAQRLGITTNCEILDDGSLLVRFDDHHLPPGQLAADFAIHSDDEAMPDGKRDIRIRPVIPVELVEGTLPGSCRHPGQAFDIDNHSREPILVNVTIPLHRPDLSRHVTHDELQKAVSALQKSIDEIRPCDMTVATDEEIKSIYEIFSTENIKPDSSGS